MFLTLNNMECYSEFHISNSNSVAQKAKISDLECSALIAVVAMVPSVYEERQASAVHERSRS